MKTIKELDDLVEQRIQEVLEVNPNHNRMYSMEHLFPEKEELEGFTTSQLLIIMRKYGMLLPYCSDCSAVRPNGKWIPREGEIEILTKGYKRFTHGYCLDCLERSGIPLEEQ
ncbi:hypothetical protein KY333_05515 [Candidatus Woesearchaeota archaeon]|nr:hypothetical protein [Candidatus Woesearchaeota archaeon]MBW2993885.1 hypothetical protein [Candidatus Woesearchaeota archaeon]